MELDRRDVLLALIDAGDGTVAGITRLQKYLFVLEQEYDLPLSREDAPVFEPYRFGPYSSQLYDDIQYLENIGFLEGDRREQAEDIDAMDFEFLSPKRGARSPSAEELVERAHFYSESTDEVHASESDLGPERRFRLTPEAKHFMDKKLATPEGKKILSACASIKSRFKSLDHLIRYVYTRYPEFTTESEIRDKYID